ncbi:fungal-specific transcription factor domain-containing protein [Aspergillus varians]
MESRSALTVQTPQRRRKRAQVARACGSCRIRRIKCDSNIPCSNCIMKGHDCSKGSAQSAFTLSQAHQEIASLKQKILQLESELKSRSSEDNIPSTPIRSTSPSVQSPSERSEINAVTPTRYWGGVYFCPARSPNSLWLGPSSLYSYVQRLSVFMSLKLHQDHPFHQMFPISASDDRLLDRPDTDSDILPSTHGTPSKPVYLSPMQEDYFLNYFWQTYHVSLLPILNETQFKKHHQSLLLPGGKERRPSALVDIVVATCMQYHISTLPLASQGFVVEGKDALVAGRWHYWRGQTLLTYELESPSLSTLQCHLLCAMYLCGGSFHNMMDSSVGLAVRIAYILGLHLDPPLSIPESDREMRKRLWWAVYNMDTRGGMKLGRPFMLNDSHVMPGLPSDTFEAATISGSIFVPVGENTTWLSFNLYQTKLYREVRAAYNSFFSKDFHLQEDHTIWDDPCSLQAGAEVLAQHTQLLEDWSDSIPEPLKLRRQNNGSPFSTDNTHLSIEQFAPHWLQRQRVLLELTYHHLILNLYRPMVSFMYRPSPGSLADELAMRCAAHAVSLTRITHQVIEETPILDGWHEAFYYQWNAVMTLIGFIMAYPDASTATEIKGAISLAISVLDNFGAKFSVAANARKIVQGLCIKADIFAEHTLAESELSNGPETVVWDDLSSLRQESSYNNISASNLVDGNNGHSELELLDLALDIDFWNTVDVLWPDDNIINFRE